MYLHLLSFIAIDYSISASFFAYGDRTGCHLIVLRRAE